MNDRARCVVARPFGIVLGQVRHPSLGEPFVQSKFAVALQRRIIRFIEDALKVHNAASRAALLFSCVLDCCRLEDDANRPDCAGRMPMLDAADLGDGHSGTGLEMGTALHAL